MSLLPWKKSRISRFMSEFQQSPKRGGSLVVETGFPTSLIDLFVKNRDRLKKSSSKRLKRQTQTASNAVSSINPVDVVMKNPVTSEVTVRSSKIEKVKLTDGESTVEKHKNAVEKKNDCGVFVMMAFKVIIVAVLAFSTKKKLTMGITLSAFALLLTELVAARVLTRFSNTDTRRRKAKTVDKNAIPCEKTETFDYRREEIQIPKSKETEDVDIPEESNLKIRDLLLKDEKSTTSKSSRLKSKIVKKLRSYRKKKKTIKIKEESLTEVSSSLVTEVKTERIKAKKDEEMLNPPLVEEESKGDKTNGIVLMIVVVLIGLLSGKILAIVLTLSCLVLRFGAVKKSSGLCM